jgi:FMN reductase
MDLLALNASHSTSSSTHHLAALAVELHGSGRVVDLATLDPAGLLGLADDAEVKALLADISAARVLVLVTPVYRATYSGLLKVLFDQLPQSGLKGVPCVLAATAASPAHYLALDTGFRSLVASVDGWTVPTVVYVTPVDLDESKRPTDAVRERMSQALAEAAQLRHEEA